MLKKESLYLCDITNNFDCPHFERKQDDQKDCFECKYDWEDAGIIHCHNEKLNKAAKFQDLIDSIETIKKWNKLSFDEFVKSYELFFNVTVSEELKEDYKFTGLNNIDFIAVMNDGKQITTITAGENSDRII